MVHLNPFRAYAYSHGHLEHLSSLFEASPFTPGEASTAFIESLPQEGLHFHQTPSFYVHAFEFEYQGQRYQRNHLFAMCKLSAGALLPHERILKSNVENLLKILEYTQAHIDPIFALYSDHEGFTEGYFETVQAQEPLYTFETPDGFHHRIWQDDTPLHLDKLTTWFQDRPLFLADGHHRHASLQSYLEQHPDAPEAAHYACVYLSNIYDPGLLLLPFHRLLKVPLAPLNELLPRVMQHFEVSPLKEGHFEEVLGQCAPEHTCIGLEYENKRFLLTRPKGLPSALKTPQNSPSYRQMDVAVVQELLLELLGFDKHWAADPQKIAFSSQMQDIHTWLKDEPQGLGLYLNPTDIQELCGVAMAGETLPPKSTYFYPKVPSGLIFADFKNAL